MNFGRDPISSNPVVDSDARVPEAPLCKHEQKGSQNLRHSFLWHSHRTHAILVLPSHRRSNG